MLRRNKQKTVSLPESERQLQVLEVQIRKLGPINLAAIEQFDEVNERRVSQYAKKICLKLKHC